MFVCGELIIQKNVNLCLFFFLFLQSKVLNLKKIRTNDYILARKKKCFICVFTKISLDYKEVSNSFTFRFTAMPRPMNNQNIGATVILESFVTPVII